LAKSASRSGRLADQIQRDLAELIRGELKDPRVDLVTITGVEVSADYSHARVFFTTLHGDDAVGPALEGLRSARPSRVCAVPVDFCVPGLPRH
jgi:ribosome-binding factor A